MSNTLNLSATVHTSRVLSTWLSERNGFERAGLQASSLERGDGPVTHRELADALGTMPSYAGPSVNETTAMRVSTVYACVGVIAGAVASLPLPIFKRAPGVRERVDHSLWWLLNEQPHPDMSAAVFWETMLCSLLLAGDAFAIIRRKNNRLNEVDALEFVNPRRVYVHRSTDESLSDGLLYTITPQDGKAYTITAADILHIPGLGFDGYRGMSVINNAARQSVGLALSSEEYSARFFSNGARPDVVLTSEKGMNDEQKKILLSTWQSKYGGVANSHLPAILVGGLKMETISINPEDAALLPTRVFQVEDICRFFGVPPHMIGHTDKSTSWGSGIEQQSIGFVKYTLQRHMVKIEQEINRKIWPLRATYYAEFETAGLERGDTKSRNESYRIALGRAGEPGWVTVNEVRRRENLPPVEGGDQLSTGVTDAQTQTAAAAV